MNCSIDILREHVPDLVHLLAADVKAMFVDYVVQWGARDAAIASNITFHESLRERRMTIYTWEGTWIHDGTWGYMDTWYSNSKFRIWKELTDKKLNLKLYLHKVVKFCHHCLFQSFFNLECCKTLTFRPSWHLINNTMLSFNLIEQIFQIKISFFL